MNRIMNSAFRLAAALTWTMLACLPAHSAIEKRSPAAQAMFWKSQLLGKPISCVVRVPNLDAERKPVMVYMHPWACLFAVTAYAAYGVRPAIFFENGPEKKTYVF